MRIVPELGDHPKRHLTRPAGPPNPFESYLLVICIAQGYAVVAGYTRPASIDALLPPSLRFVWGALLLLGGIAAVIGLYWPGDALDSILIKRVGLLAAGGGTLAYGVALMTLGPSAFIASLFNLGFTLACYVRAAQVTRALNRFRSEMKAIREVGPIPAAGQGEGE